MEYITLPQVINWPVRSVPSAEEQIETKVYTNFLEKVKDTPKPETLERELIFISSIEVTGIASVAFNIPLVVREVRKAYYCPLFQFQCLNVIVNICCPILARLIRELVVAPLVYITREDVLLSLPKNKSVVDEIAYLAKSASQSDEALGNLDIALGRVLQYKCPSTLESIFKIKIQDRVTYQYMAVINETKRVQLFSFSCHKEHLDIDREEIKTKCKQIKLCFKYFEIGTNIKVKCSLEYAELTKIKKHAKAQLAFVTKEKVQAELVNHEAQQLNSGSSEEEIRKIKKAVLNLKSTKHRRSK